MIILAALGTNVSIVIKRTRDLGRKVSSHSSNDTFLFYKQIVGGRVERYFLPRPILTMPDPV